MNKLTKISEATVIWQKSNYKNCLSHDSRSFEIFLQIFLINMGRKFTQLIWRLSHAHSHHCATWRLYRSKMWERNCYKYSREGFPRYAFHLHSIACVCKRAKFNWWRKNIKATYRGKYKERENKYLAFSFEDF